MVLNIHRPWMVACTILKFPVLNLCNKQDLPTEAVPEWVKEKAQCHLSNIFGLSHRHRKHTRIGGGGGPYSETPAIFKNINRAQYQKSPLPPLLLQFPAKLSLLLCNAKVQKLNRVTCLAIGKKFSVHNLGRNWHWTKIEHVHEAMKN